MKYDIMDLIRNGANLNVYQTKVYPYIEKFDRFKKTVNKGKVNMRIESGRSNPIDIKVNDEICILTSQQVKNFDKSHYFPKVSYRVNEIITKKTNRIYLPQKTDVFLHPDEEKYYYSLGLAGFFQRDAFIMKKDDIQRLMNDMKAEV